MTRWLVLAMPLRRPLGFVYARTQREALRAARAVWPEGWIAVTKPRPQKEKRP